MKKVLALTLALVLALGMSTVAFAAAGKLDRGFKYGDMASDYAGYKPVVDGDATNFDIDLDVNYFYMAASQASNHIPGDDIASRGTASKQLINKNNVTLKIKWSKGSEVFDGVSIKYDSDGASFIRFAYNDAIKSIKDINYKYQLLVLVDGKTSNNTDGDFIVEGTYSPDENDGFWSDDWFRFEGRNYLKPTDYVRNMEYVLNEDEDVTVWGRALKGVKYYGYAKTDWTSTDEQVAVDHPEVVGVYHIDQINLANVTDHVTFNNEDASLYVYDGDLNLLGKVSDKITTLCDTYYLASAILDVDDADEPIDDGDDGDDGYEPDDWGGNSGTGGDDLYPENPHDNPGTGK